MTIYSIYKITNTVNNKVYIGFTSKKNPIRRFNEHISETETGSSRIICKAIRKYGRDFFIFDVIYQSTSKKHILEMEKFFIIECNSYCKINGYNATLGGEGTCGFKRSKEKNREHAEFLTGKKHSKKTKEKMSIAAKRRMESMSEEDMRTIGKKISEKLAGVLWSDRYDNDTILKKRKVLSDAAKGDKNAGGKAVRGKYKLTKEDGTIEIILGMTGFCRDNGYIRKYFNLLQRGIKKSCYGYIKVERLE